MNFSARETPPTLPQTPLRRAWNASRKSPLLFPPAAARPSALLWVWLLPQALLLYLNWQAWDLVGSEMNASQRASAAVCFGLESALLLGGLGLCAACALLRRPIPRLAGGGLLAGTSIYLAVVFTETTNAIPASVRDWMLPPGPWAYQQFILVGLGALYGAFRLLCPDREGSTLARAATALGALLAPFAILLAAMSLSASGLAFGIRRDAFEYLFVPASLFATMLAAGAILRLCIGAYTAARRTSPAALFGVTLVVAFGLPLGGLLTNDGIAFPADFQSPVVYTLAILNGLVLCLPNFSQPLAHRLVWLAQCALLPFTAYFFAVFLPVLPLMPLGTFFFGLGLLICVPSALFLLHGCRVLDGLHAEIRDGRKWLPTALALGAILLGPVLLTTQILRDRAALHQALDYLHAPDFSRPTFAGDRAALRSSLLHLRDFKEGRYLPLFSEFYNWLAFDNLLLPDQTLANTWLAFFGEPMPAAKSRRHAMPFLGEDRPRTASQILAGAPAGERPAARAALAGLRVSSAASPGQVRATARLTVHNATATPTEYRALIHLPDGVFLTGLKLTIGAEDVPARLFEERAALWIYDKLTEARPVPRDPALLRIIAPQTAELRVYPVESDADRRVEVEFTWPDNLTPALTIDGRPLEVPAARAPATAFRAGDAAWVPPAALAAIPPLHRTPQPHLIVDTSKASPFREAGNLAAALRRALDAFPGSLTARVTFANFETRDLRNGASIPVGELRALSPAELREAAGPFDGGFLEPFAIKSVLTRALLAPAAQLAREYPALIVLRGTSTPIDFGANSLPPFAALLPDQPCWRSLDPGAATPVVHPLDPLAPPSDQSRPVRLFRNGSRALLASAAEPAFLTGLAPGALSIFDPARARFVPLPVSSTAGDAAARATAPWSLADRRTFTPAAAGAESLSQLLASAREARVLVPSTAYLVVENQAQWKMLERTEKKTLKAHEALALQEPASTPEPGVLSLLLLGGLAWFGWARFRARPSSR